MSVTTADVLGRDVPLVVGFGGGVNSMAVLVALRQRDIVPDLITFADTGGEKPETYAYFSIVRGWLAKAGFPALTLVKNASPKAGDDSLEEESVRRETMPSRAFGMSSCAMRWKVEPQEKFLRRWEPARAAWKEGRKPIKVLGYDGGEERRAKITEDKILRYWYPLLDWKIDRAACEALIRSERLPLPPKSACFFCPSSTKTEVIALHRDHPNLFARAARMESIALKSERHNLRNIKGLGRHWSWADLVAMSMVDQSMLLEAPVESCTICDDDGCEAAR